MKLSRAFNKVKFDAKQAAPGFMVATSVVTGIIAVVEFCRKTRDALPVIDEYKETVSELTESHETVVAHAEKEGHTDIVKQENKTYAKDIVVETAKTGVALAKIYAKPIALYAVSVGLNVKSYRIMKGRNVALAAAYAGVGTELRNVYSRINEKYGTEALDEIKHGIKKVEVEETYIDEKTGEEVTEKKTVSVIDGSEPNKYSIYARFFDEGSRLWCDDAESNLTILREREEEANKLLRSRGYLLLNDVYEMLDLKCSKAGTKVGWRYIKKNGKDANPCGDNRVSFNIYDIRDARHRDFVNGYEKVILLDFNVDGEIVDALPLPWA